MSDSLLFVNAVVDGPPTAIVILFGWLGAKHRHIEKYAKLYQDRNCSTIYGVADVMAVMLARKKNLSDFGLEAAEEAIKLLKAVENPKTVPVILHSFSGAGAVVLEQLTLRIQEAQAADQPTSLQEDLILFGQAIQRGGEFFDSCPAYFHTSTGLKAIEQGVPNFYVRIVIQVIFILMHVIQLCLGVLKGEKRTRPQEHWSAIQESDLANRQAYIYSTADAVVDYEMLENLIEHRKQIPMAKIFVQKFNDVPHCSHLVKHPKEYQGFVDEFLASILEEKKETEILEQVMDEDPDMTDYQMEMD